MSLFVCTDSANMRNGISELTIATPRTPNGDTNFPMATSKMFIAVECLLYKLEHHLHQWIACVGVEACRDKEQIGFKRRQFFQRPLRHLDMLASGRPWAEWIIRHIRK